MRIRTYSKAINRYGVSITELQVIILFNSMWEDFVIRLFVNKKHQQDADQHTLYLIDAQRKAIDLLEKTASDIKNDRRRVNDDYNADSRNARASCCDA